MNAALADQPQAEMLLDVPSEIYHRKELGVVSNTVLGILRNGTPAHYRAWIDEPEGDDTPALAFGRAYHMRVLEPARFARTYVAPPQDPPRRPSSTQRNAKKPSQDTLEAIAWWDAWESENAGRETLSADDFDKIEAMHAALMRNPQAASIFRDGHAEATFRWTDEATGLRCKARADWLRPREFIADLKTTEDASPGGFAKAVARYGYHVQHAHYVEGARACGQPVDDFLIVAQEKRAPYLAAVYRLDAASEARGFELRQEGMQEMAECVATGIWPGYAPDVSELSIPAWAFGEVMEISYVE